MENNNNKKFVLAVVFGVIVFVVSYLVIVPTVHTWLSSTLPNLFDPTGTNLDRPQGYLAMIRTFHILSFLLYMTIIVTTILMAIGNGEKKSKICAIVNASCYAVLILFLIIAGSSIPSESITSVPQVWNTAYSGMFTTFRSILLPLILFTGLLSTIAAWPVLKEIPAKIFKKGDGEKKTEKKTTKPAQEQQQQ